MHSCHASHQVCQVTPISAGLLIERQVTGEVGSDGLPTLFTLLHPMADLCPVILHRPSASEFQTYSLFHIEIYPIALHFEVKTLAMICVFSFPFDCLIPAAPSTLTVLGFFTDAQLHCVGSCECEGSSLILLHHAVSGAHSLWEIKPAKPEVRQDGTQLNCDM